MRCTGVVDWFDVEKGFGFIKNDLSEDKVYVQWSALEVAGFKLLMQGDRVEYEAIEGSNGVQAIHVKKINK